MSFAQISLTLQGIEDAARKLGQLAVVDQEDLISEVGSILLSSTQHRIAHEKTGPQGEVWDPWSKDYAATRHGGHSLLLGHGDLHSSLANISEGLVARVGVHMAYGAIHQAGGQAGRNRSVTIPARPYLGLSSEDRRAITNLVVERVEAALS